MMQLVILFKIKEKVTPKNSKLLEKLTLHG